MSGKTLLTAVIQFNVKQYCLYINGTQYSCSAIPDNVIKRLQEKGYNIESFLISGSGGEPFSGIIDDVKIYKKVLNTDEIKQQAKIAGF